MSRSRQEWAITARRAARLARAGKGCGPPLKITTTPSDKRRRLWIKYEKRCFYCEKNLSLIEVSIDHYIPTSKGGGGSFENLRASCVRCNCLKANMMPDEFRDFQQIQQMKSDPYIEPRRCASMRRVK